MLYSEWLDTQAHGEEDTDNDEKEDEKKSKDNDKGCRRGDGRTDFIEGAMDSKEMAGFPTERAEQDHRIRIARQGRIRTDSLLDIKKQTNRLCRHLYTNRQGYECLTEMMLHFVRVRPNRSIRNEWDLTETLVCEIMQMNTSNLQPGEATTHVKFWLPTHPRDIAWLSLPFGGNNFPELPETFSVGQQYGMIIEMEDIGRGNCIIRAKNHYKKKAFHELYTRKKIGELQPSEFITFMSKTESGGTIKTIQVLEKCRRNSMKCDMNLNGRKFDLLETRKGIAIAMQDDRLFESFPELIPGHAQILSAVLEPLPNGRIVLPQADGVNIFIDWRVTNLLFENGTLLHGPRFEMLEPQNLSMGPVQGYKPPEGWKLSVCRHPQPKKEVYKLNLDSNLDKFFHRMRNIFSVIRSNYGDLYRLKNYNARELLRVCQFFEEHQFNSLNLFTAFIWLYRLIEDPQDLEIIKRIGVHPPSLAYCIVENLHYHSIVCKAYFSPLQFDRIHNVLNRYLAMSSTIHPQRSRLMNTYNYSYFYLDVCQSRNL